MGKILSAFVRNTSPFAVITKSADETRVSDIVQTADSELKFQANPNKNYFVMLFLANNSPAAADFDYAWSVPSGSAVFIDSTWDANTNQTLDDWTAEQFLAGAAADVAIIVYGMIRIGVTGGEVNLTWAQNVSNAGNTSVLKGSTIMVYQS